MGKTKIKVIDDSTPVEEKPKRKKILGTNIERDQKLKEPKSKERAKIGAASQLSEAGEVSSESTSTNVHEPDRAGPPVGGAELEKQVQLSERKSTPKSPPKSKKVRSKKYQEALSKIDRQKSYPVDEATKLIKQVSYSKFDGTLEIHINTNIKNIRGLINLPFSSGKKLKILAFGPSTEFTPSKVEGLRMEKIEGVTWGDDQALAEIEKGKLDFDILITTPEWMPKLAKVAKFLGPRGLMPNPKNETITQDLKKTITQLQGGKTEFKTEPKANVIHLGIGKITQPDQELSENIKILLSSIGKTKIKKAVISPTMGPGIKLNLSSI